MKKIEKILATLVVAHFATSCFSAGIADIPDGDICGDGKVLWDEQCDDGNTVNGDGCSDSCQKEGIISTYYNAAGGDSTWFTGDDMISSYEITKYNMMTNGRLQYIITAASGSDSTWYTWDDEIVGYNEYTYDAKGNNTGLTTYTKNGIDNLPFTADDGIGNDGNWLYLEEVPYSSTQSIYNADKKVIKRWNITGPGTDNTWFTNDDILPGGYTVYSYNINGKLGLEEIYSIGVNNSWFDGDDVLESHITHQYDGSGRKSKQSHYTNSVLQFYYLYTYGANNRVSKISLYSDIDVLLSYDLYTYDAKNRVYEFSSHTNLDTVTYKARYSYNSANQKTRSLSSTHPGADSIFFTDDDTNGLYYFYLYNSGGYLTKTIQYAGPGGDDAWDTGDETVLNYTENTFREIYYPKPIDLWW